MREEDHSLRVRSVQWPGGWARPVCWSSRRLPVSWEVGLLLCSTCREGTSRREALPRVRFREEGWGEESRVSLLRLLFSQAPPLGCAHSVRCIACCARPAPRGSVLSPCPHPTPLQPHRLRHAFPPSCCSSARRLGRGAHSRSFPLSRVCRSRGREILTFAKYCLEWPLCVSLGLGSLYSKEEKAFLSVFHSDS